MTDGGIVKGRTPDLTAAQIAAVVGWIVAQLVAFGLLDAQDEQIAVSSGSTLLALALKAADAYIRGRRAKMVAALALAKTAEAPKP